MTSLSEFFLGWENFRTKVVQKIKTHVLYSKFFFRKSCRLWGYVGKMWQITDGSTAQALYMVHNWGYRLTLRI